MRRNHLWVQVAALGLAILAVCALRPTALYAQSGGTITSDGHILTALAIDIAERTPNARAS